MNHQFPGSRSPGSGAIGPFYNPQKDAPNPNNPTLYQPPPQPTLPFPANSSSKSYIARSNIMDLKPPANNTSAYVKNPTEGPVGAGKFGGNNVTSPTSAYSSTNYQGFTSPYQPKLSSEMVKSLIHENASSARLRAAARRQGMRTMREDGVRKVLAGLTTIEEVVSVTVGDLD